MIFGKARSHCIFDILEFRPKDRPFSVDRGIVWRRRRWALLFVFGFHGRFSCAGVSI
jgi:hypothetical protein